MDHMTTVIAMSDQKKIKIGKAIEWRDRHKKNLTETF